MNVLYIVAGLIVKAERYYFIVNFLEKKMDARVDNHER